MVQNRHVYDTYHKNLMTEGKISEFAEKPSKKSPNPKSQMKSESYLSLLIAPFFFLLLLLAFPSTTAEKSTRIGCGRSSQHRKMATLGGIQEFRGAQNSAEVEDLARFAVQEHNNKEVLSLPS